MLYGGTGSKKSWAAKSGGSPGEKNQRNAQCWKTLSSSVVKAEIEKTILHVTMISEV
jgi:hypothetical protein